MDNPSWTEVLSADATLGAAIGAWVTAVVAGVALWFARKAAIEAGTQAKAAWQAVVAAEQQVKLLEKQLIFSEPQPVLSLSLDCDLESGMPVQFKIHNFGEQLAFDVALSPIEMLSAHAGESCALRFETLPVVPKGLLAVIRASVEPPLGSKLLQANSDRIRAFLKLIVTNHLTDVRRSGSEISALYVLGTLVLTYRNVRGRRFDQPFRLVVRDRRIVTFEPEGSLVAEE